MKLLKQMAQADKEGRVRGAKTKIEHTTIALIMYTLITIGTLFNVINFTAFIIMTLVYIYFIYEYGKHKKPIDELVIHYNNCDPKQSIKDLDGKIMRISINVSNTDNK